MVGENQRSPNSPVSFDLENNDIPCIYLFQLPPAFERPTPSEETEVSSKLSCIGTYT